MNFNHDIGLIDVIQSIDTTSLPPLGGVAGVLQIIGTGGLVVQTGTVLQRPTGVFGMVRGNTDASSLEFYDGTGWLDLGKQGTVTSVALAGSTGLTITGSPITSSGTITVTLGTELQALAGISANGHIVRTGSGTYASRTITGTAGNIVLTNGDGVSGNPTVNLATVGAGGTTVGSSTSVPVLSYDTYGRVTAATNTAIAFPVTSVFGRTGVVSAVSGDYTLAQIGTVNLSAPTAGNVLTYNGSNWVNAAPATAGTVTSVAATGSTGLTVTGSPITTAGTLSFTLGSELQGLSGLSSSGMIARTGAGTYTSRVIAGTTGQVAVTNGDGVAGAPTIALAPVTQTSGGTFSKVTIDTYGRVSQNTPVVAADITSLVDATYVNVNGDTVTGNLTFSGGATITGLPTPTAASDATPKSYVDAAVTGLSWKQSVRAATTTAGTLASSFENGDVIDGVTLATGDRILIKNQAAGTENGIYVVQASGAPTRAEDANVAAELTGASVFVDAGTANADTGWVLTTNSPITLGTSNLVFAQFSGSGTYTAGNGLALNGNVFSLVTPVAVSNGGTGTSTIGAANTVLGVNAGGTAYEAKAITAGTGVSVVNTAGVITINNTGVTSVGLSAPAIFTVSNSPVTTTGNLTFTLNSQTAGNVLAGPVGNGTPVFRPLTYTDLPFKLYTENPSSQTTPLAAGTNAVAIGSSASAPLANSFAVGAGTATPLAGSKAYANGQFATPGDAQHVDFVLRNVTTAATTTELFLDGATGTLRAVLPNNSLWTFTMLVSARRTDATGGAAGYKFEGVIRKDATSASTAFVGTPSKAVLGETNVGWDVALVADTTNGTLRVNVTGEAAKTIRWVASVSVSQVTS